MNKKINDKDLTATTTEEVEEEPRYSADVILGRPLSQPPDVIKAVYLTSWTAGQKHLLENFIQLAKSTDINAFVIDVNGFSGYVAYNTELPIVERYNTGSIRIADLQGGKGAGSNQGN